MASTRQELEREILDGLTKKARKGKNGVTLDATFDELGLDSLDKVETVMDLEEQYKMKIPDEIAEKFTRGRDVVDYITREKEYN
jgi:acyl carrier protein